MWTANRLPTNLQESSSNMQESGNLSLFIDYFKYFKYL